MKKLLVALFAFIGFSVGTQAQSLEAGQPKRQLTKEEKEMKRIKDEVNMLIAFKQIGLDEETQKKVNEVLKESNVKTGEIRRNPDMTDEAKKTAIDAANKARVEKMKEIMGAEKFAQFQEIRKKQKEEAKQAEQQAQAAMPSKE